MSMYRQLWLATLLSTLIALAGSLLASTLSARSYLTEQLHMKNMDNAAALALSLSQHKQDATSVAVVAAAMFDSGHYALIRITDPHGAPMVELRADPVETADAPQWFTRLLPIEAAPGYARISSGWKQFGDVTLLSHSRFAYQALWHSVLATMAALIAAGLLAGLLATLILRRIRQPLDHVIRQAQAITERRFITIKEPRVPELRSLAAAMNSMVGRLHAMFDEEARRLERVRHEANCDAVTGLLNRDHFVSALHAAAEGEEARGGVLLLLRLAGLGTLNQRLGRPATDALLRKAAAILSQQGAAQQPALAARMNGSDFGLLLPGTAYPYETACQLLKQLDELRAEAPLPSPAAYIGFGEFQPGDDVSTLLAGVDAALLAAEHAGDSLPRMAPREPGRDAPITQQQWLQALRRAIDNNWMMLAAFPVTDFAGHVVHYDSPLRLMFDERESWSAAGRFLPMAERLDLVTELDLAALRLALDELRAHPDTSGLAINLSANSIRRRDFREQFRSLLERDRDLADRLWLDIAEQAAFEHLDSLQLFAEGLAGNGFKVRIGIEHFGRRFGQIEQLYPLGLDYLKVDAAFIRQADSHAGNQSFLQGLAGVAHAIGLKVYAQGVSTPEELAVLARLGLDGATGPLIRS